MSTVQFSRSVMSDSLRPHELQHARPPCPSPTPEVDSNSCPWSRWCHPSSHLILCRPLLLKSDTVSTVSPPISHEVMGPDAMILVFWMLSFKPTFSLSSFTFVKRLFSFSSLSAIRVVSSAHLRLLIFLLAILNPACASSSPAFLMMYSAYKLNTALITLLSSIWGRKHLQCEVSHLFWTSDQDWVWVFRSQWSWEEWPDVGLRRGAVKTRDLKWWSQCPGQGTKLSIYRKENRETWKVVLKILKL